MMISLNKVNVTGCPADEYERVYKQASDYMATQPGHISQLFLRSENHPGTYFAVGSGQAFQTTFLITLCAAATRADELGKGVGPRARTEGQRGGVAFSGVAPRTAAARRTGKG